MSDAKARFFARMNNDLDEREMSERSNVSTTSPNVDIDFSITESGRTVAHMVTETNRSMDSMMDFSITQSTRSNTGAAAGGTVTHNDDSMNSMSAAAVGGFTESERDELVKMFGPGSNGTDALLSSPTQVTTEYSKGPMSTTSGTTRTQSIPVPRVPNPLQQQQPQPQSLLSHPGGGTGESSGSSSLLPSHPQGGGSSYGSSNSAFLSSVLNPNGTSSSEVSQPLSHTPPTASSYEVSHFGKRPRSGSVSSRLRSASDYFERKGLLDRQTKGILKDLVIIGDTEMEQALRHYEEGDPSVLEGLIRSGGLQSRLPKDLDLLGDLDFDFLNMHDEADLDLQHASISSGLPHGQQNHHQHHHMVSSQPQSITVPHHFGQSDNSMNHHHHENDDGIGDLDFDGDFAMDAQVARSYGSSRQPSAAASPSDLSDYDRRMRSNSLFTALMNEPKPHDISNTAAQILQGQWVQTGTPPLVMPGQNAAHAGQGGITIRGGRGAQNRSGTRLTKAQQRQQQSGISASLEAERKRQEKEAKKEKKEQRKAERERKAQEKRKEEAELEVHVPGSGKPYPLDDPQLVVTIDAYGLRHVKRPEGWVGAYSPTSRKVRIQRFVEKRNHRVWTKSVKYDVRKNFADSRLRVKGRFVKKEDELLMRVSRRYTVHMHRYTTHGAWTYGSFCNSPVYFVLFFRS
jgi:hypothetical protein